jgi:hypothetical protein
VKRFHIVLQVPGIGRVRLPVPRTEADIAILRTRYSILEATPVGDEPNGDAWGAALAAVIRLHQTAKSQGDLMLAAMAERALGELFGTKDRTEADPFPGSITWKGGLAKPR